MSLHLSRSCSKDIYAAFNNLSLGSLLYPSDGLYGTSSRYTRVAALSEKTVHSLDMP